MGEGRACNKFMYTMQVCPGLGLVGNLYKPGINVCINCSECLSKKLTVHIVIECRIKPI